ncbi:MAG: methyltransferase domain-containing protein [Desulfitobacterium hafniense]|nr:methyltransferase domain-containing protein [Desulfitobacterium hafniense]
MSVFEIIDRYSQERDSNLSCGNNLGYLAVSLGESIVDLGCGRGLEAIEVAKLVGDKGYVWGVDITPRMIELARKNAGLHKANNISFLVGLMDDLPFKDNSVDAVLSNCAINHVEDKAAVYREIHRILKPGGRFVVSDIMTDEPLPPEIKSDPQAIASCFGGAITVKEYQHALLSAGFSEVRVLKEKRYTKNGYDMISRTFTSRKPELDDLRGGEF